MNTVIVKQEEAKSAVDQSEEEARAERKRRQRLAQEEFRLKQLMKHNTDEKEKQELSRNSSSFDKLLMDIPTQDIVIESTGEDSTKRKSPGPDGNVAKRRTGSVSKLNIVKND